MIIFNFMNNIRYQIRPSTGRDIIKIGKYIIKYSNNLYEIFYEYQNLLEIASSNTKLFRVPKVINLIKGQNYGAIIMEYVSGHNLDNYILRFLLQKDMNTIKIFYKIGESLREFHNLNLSNLKINSLAATDFDLKNEITKLSEDLVKLGIVNEQFFSDISSIIKKYNIDSRIFMSASLHGEFYFTHIILHNGEIVFIDLHNAQRGPLYFDLAMFNISLYSSLMFLPWNPKSLIPLTRAFLLGYLGQNDDYFIKSLGLAELYIALREILSYVHALYTEGSFIRSLLSAFKIRRFKSVIDEIILSRLRAEIR